MTKITREEILKIAAISKLEILEEEISQLKEQLEAVLSYAARVREIAADAELATNQSVNILREDIAVQTNSEPILAQAPDHEDNFFVVPKIIENN